MQLINVHLPYVQKSLHLRSINQRNTVRLLSLLNVHLIITKKTNDSKSKILLLQLLANAKYYTGQRTAIVEHSEEALKYSLSDLNLYYESAIETCAFLLYFTGTIRIYYINLLWMLYKQAVHYIVFADTISADTFSFTSSNDNGKASADVSLSSDHLEFIQPELAIPVRSLFGDLFEAFFQLITHLFSSIFNISNVVYAINVLFIVLKMFIIFCISCCSCYCCICRPLFCIVKILIFVIRSCLRSIFFN